MKTLGTTPNLWTFLDPNSGAAHLDAIEFASGQTLMLKPRQVAGAWL